MEYLRTLFRTEEKVNDDGKEQEPKRSRELSRPKASKEHRSLNLNIVDWNGKSITNSKKINPTISDSTLFQASVGKNKVCCKYIEEGMNLIQTGMHGFHDALYLAYSQHLTLGIRPDHIWLTILQSFSRHIELNSEKFKHLFTESDKKETLTVEIEHNKFIQFIDSMASQLLGKIKFDPLLEFTTSTEMTVAVGKVSLMAMCKSFYDYECTTECGIPNINVYGTIEDWNMMIEKVKVLGKLFEVEDWTNTLVEVISKIRDCDSSSSQTSNGNLNCDSSSSQTSNGNLNCDSSDLKFWSSIYKYHGGSGGPFVSGWFLAFYLYGFPFKRRPVWKVNWKMQNLGDANWYINSSSIPNEILEVPYKYNDNGNVRNMVLYSGMCGVVQDGTTGEVQPCVGWCAADVNKQ